VLADGGDGFCRSGLHIIRRAVSNHANGIDVSPQGNVFRDQAAGVVEGDEVVDLQDIGTGSGHRGQDVGRVAADVERDGNITGAADGFEYQALRGQHKFLIEVRTGQPGR